MRRAGVFRSNAIRRFLAALALASVASLYAEDMTPPVSPVVPVPAPGTYAFSCAVTFSVPEQTRLLVSIDGAPFAEYVLPIQLSAPDGTEREFSVKTELRGFGPGSSVIDRSSFVWRIDRQRPPAPLFVTSVTEGGTNVSVTVPGGGTVRYQMYHPFSGAVASSEIRSGESVFVPDGASLCATPFDGAGNQGPPASPEPPVADPEGIPFVIVNPLPGNWANRQALLVDRKEGVVVRYSVDGSDPAVNGRVYTDPVPIDASGLVNLRVLAVGTSGQTYEKRVLYTVDQRDPPSGLRFPDAGGASATASGIVRLGEFGEISIPAGVKYTLSGSVPDTDGGKSVAFTALRNAVRQYPLTVSDGASSWRWLCTSGIGQKTAGTGGTDAVNQSAMAPGAKEVDPDAPGAKKSDPNAPGAKAPGVRILDWHFIAIQYDAPVYWSLDRRNWSPYREPVFVDRASDSVLYWYSSAWKESAVQTLALPVKPVITGFPAGGVTGNPVFVSVEESPYTLRYEIGAEFSPAPPTDSSPELDGTIIFDVPNGASAPFTVRVRAVCDGMVHGDFLVPFVVDRKTPRIPLISAAPDVAWAHSPVSVFVSGEDMIQLAVEPDGFRSNGNETVLEGVPGKAVEYTVTAFAVDRAGNRSASASRNITVERNVLHVDASRRPAPGSAPCVPDGTPAAPFPSLDEALDAVTEQGSWFIDIQGEAALAREHALPGDVRISGTGAIISVSADARLVARGTRLEVAGCAIRGAGSRDGPLFDLDGGSFVAVNADIDLAVPVSGSVVRAVDCAVSCLSSAVSFRAAEYGNVFDVTGGSFRSEASDLAVNARNSAVVSLTASDAQILSTSCTSEGGKAGRGIEAWASTLSLSLVTLERRYANPKNRDVAFWYDHSCPSVRVEGLRVEGFPREIVKEDR